MRCTALLLGFTLVACGGKTFEDVQTTTDGGTDSGSVSDTAPADAAPDYRWCSGTSDCLLMPTTCCGTCSQPTTENMTGVNRGSAMEWTHSLCGPEPVACPACAPAIFDGSVQAWCVAKRCTAIDVRKEPVSTCETDADCALRYKDCCEPCEEKPFDLIALNPAKVSEYRAKVCVGDETCSRCAARYPEGSSAVCDPVTKHCRVKSPMLP